MWRTCAEKLDLVDDGLVLAAVVGREEERDRVHPLELHEPQREHLRHKVGAPTFNTKVLAITLNNNAVAITLGTDFVRCIARGS